MLFRLSFHHFSTPCHQKQLYFFIAFCQNSHLQEFSATILLIISWLDGVAEEL
jgi:hypothetical protein